jgi:hypothetical protein
MFGEKRTFLTRGEIIKIKTMALRKGVWFRALTKTERACVELAIIVVERVRSRLLLNVLCSLVKKLEEAMESRVYRLLREVGSILVRKLSVIALKWGNKSARDWVVDYGFMRYLVITEMNLSR